MGVDAFSGFLTFVRDSIAYGFLIYNISLRELSAGDFVLYFGLISQYISWLLGLIQDYGQLMRINYGFNDVRDFLEIPDYFNRSAGAPLPMEAPQISFRDVSFTYPGSPTPTLSHINITVMPG